MKRAITDDLMRWKNKRDRKPLLLTGVRQCGKTYILNKFANEEYEDVAYLNLEKTPQIGQVFEKDFDVNRIIVELSNLFVRKPIVPGKTLLVLDEIQIQPKAITAMKYFYEDMRDLSVIGAGSLLGVSLRKQEESFPIGKIDRLEMYPMSFVEFMWANHFDGYIKTIEVASKVDPLPSYVMDEIEALFLEYLIVGGMPEAVATWVATKDMASVAEVQDNILFGYENDFSKHAPINELNNIQMIWKSAPEQLAKDNNKFVFSRVKKTVRAKNLEGSMGWLVDAGLIHVLKKVENARIPLSAYQDSSFYKVFLCDVGLLCRRANFNMRSLVEKSAETGGFRGSLIENYVLNELLSLRYAPYFWRSGNTAELDFLIEENGQIIPIEAKANINTQAKSYKTFADEYRTKQGFKFSLKNIGINTVVDTETISLPLFLVWRMKEYLKN